MTAQTPAQSSTEGLSRPTPTDSAESILTSKTSDSRQYTEALSMPTPLAPEHGPQPHPQPTSR